MKNVMEISAKKLFKISRLLHDILRCLMFLDHYQRIWKKKVVNFNL